MIKIDAIKTVFAMTLEEMPVIVSTGNEVLI